MTLLGPAYIRRAEIYEQMGDEQKAIEYYTRLMRMWDNCDPELLPIRDAAEAELERLLVESVLEPA